jgi:hypothetical protein
MGLRAPIDTTGGRPTLDTELQVAIRVVRRAGVLEPLARLLDAEVGRPRTISLLGFLVGAQLNALARHHQGHLVEIARVLNALTDAQRQRLGLGDWAPAQTYDRLERLFIRLCAVLDERHEIAIGGRRVRLDAGWFANRFAAAAVPEDLRESGSVAVDGTDLETWGALHGDAVSVQLDGEARSSPDALPSKVRRPTRTAKVLGIGPDGRKIYTVDPDARAGHRSATNSRPAGPYVGYELHLAVQTRTVRWTNGIDKTTLGLEVAGVITNLSLVPAGTHRAEAVVDRLIAAKGADQPLDEVVWDPGYSLCRPETAQWPLAQAGIEATFQPVTHQRSERPFAGDARLIDGALYSAHLPDDLVDLPMPPRGATEAEKVAYEAAFNRRARWRYVRHAGPDTDGATRWRCPFCAGLLRSRQIPKTMRRSRTAPLEHLESDRCCDGILTVQPVALPLWQRLLPGTTAWRISMGRRQVVESVNAAIKGAFVDLGRGFLRVMGQTKATVLLGFSVAGFNLDRVRAFRAKHRRPSVDEGAEFEPAPPPQRPKRRKGTWAELLEIEQRTDPPPG